MNTNGAVIWKGLSHIDGVTPIVVIITGINKASANAKTGAMLQTYIMVADRHPQEALELGYDSAVCGGCIHRAGKDGKRSCYVNIVVGGPAPAYGCYKRGNYPLADWDQQRSILGMGRIIRVGTYGDPAAVPIEVWDSLLKLSVGHTGYTHQWRSPKFSALKDFCMASCETSDDVAKANANGWGTFRVIPLDEDTTELWSCPASKEAGKQTTCEECLKCNGNEVNVWIKAHGATRNNYTGTRKPLPTL
jgi:hypothetical protein